MGVAKLNKQEIHEDEIEDSNSKNELISEKAWRREKVWELKSKGYSHREILEELKGKDPLLKISLGTITNDLEVKRREIKANFQQYIDELPAYHQMALTNLKNVNKEAWRIFERTNEEKTKLAALHTAQEAQAAINTLLGDPEFIAKAIAVAGKLRKQMEDKP